MGNTSVNTACKPRFFRLDCGISAWRNSRYELVCNSIRLGGAMISLILPKLTRSVALDGILTLITVDRFCLPVRYFSQTTQGKNSVFTANLPDFKPLNVASMSFRL